MGKAELCRAYVRGVFPQSLFLSVSALAITCTMTDPAAAQAPTLGKLTVVSAGSIFTKCTADHVGSQPGINYPNTNIEPTVAINPANPGNMLVGSHQDRWSNGGARGLRGAYSFDNGVTFHPSSTPDVTVCQNGPWPRASDPWVTFSPDGAAYFSSLVTEELANPALFGHNGQTVSQSIDGGMNWLPPTTLIDTPAQPDATKPQALNDKNAVTADPANSRYVYVVWDKLTSFTPGFGVNDETGGNDGGHPSALGTLTPATPKDGLSITRRLRDLALQGRPFGRVKAANADSAAAAFPTYVTGPAYFSRTTDYGRHWELPKVIFDPGSNFQTIANQVVVLPGGDILDFYTQQNDLSGADIIGWVRSSDHGKTWSPGYSALTLVNVPALTPNRQEAIRSADIIYAIAVDPANKAIYVTWQDSRFTGQNEVALAYSSDGGYSWSAPVRVNQTPRNPSNPVFQQALIPTVTAAADGTVVVTYYDFRHDKVGATTDATDYWAVSCNPIKSADGCQSNADWANEARITARSFDYNDAPVAGGHFLGDYMGLKSRGQTVWPVFGISPSKNVTSVVTRPLTLTTAK